jgi:TetR/AcrR family transcriptional repressor of nem operon
MALSRGRPRKFGIDTVTDDALGVFWGKGYTETSITELTAATGSHPGALYQSFGSKRGLFLAALRRYSERGLGRIEATLTGGPPPADRLRAYLLDQIELSWSARGSRGCLMANSALEVLPGDPEVAAAIASHFARLQQHLAAAVAQAQRGGEVSDEWPADAIAFHLLLVVEGMFVLGRTQPSRDALLTAVDLTLNALRPREPEDAA